MSEEQLFSFDLQNHQHQRYNPLKGEWVLVSPHRLQRPWMGQQEGKGDGKAPPEPVIPNNPLLPGAQRGNGVVNPFYESTYTFPNDFPALNEVEVKYEANPRDEVERELFQLEPVNGCCRVMCFHPNSQMTLPLMTIPEIVSIIQSWKQEAADLGSRFVWVQIFENKGVLQGCSNPHPHCQIWASSFLPNEPRVKDGMLKSYYEKHGRPMLVDYVAVELEKKERIVLENEDWVALVPFWAMWPFETMLLPRKPGRNVELKRLTDLSADEELSLADAIKRLTTRYDNLFESSCPYSMGFHGAPTGSYLEKPADHWTLHALFYPPLLRSATVRKFMVGYELLAQPQRDMTAEIAAGRLQELSDVHYKMAK